MKLGIREIYYLTVTLLLANLLSAYLNKVLEVRILEQQIEVIKLEYEIKQLELHREPILEVEIMPEESYPVSPYDVLHQNDVKIDSGLFWEGEASYYSREGCVGCSPNLTMANGNPLDDEALTLAFNQAPLGTKLKIINIETGDSIVAEVTDTGGFESLGRIADLSLATKNAISCRDLCRVKIEKL